MSISISSMLSFQCYVTVIILTAFCIFWLYWRLQTCVAINFLDLMTYQFKGKVSCTWRPGIMRWVRRVYENKTERSMMRPQATFSLLWQKCRYSSCFTKAWRTDGRTDRPGYRDARTHLKIDFLYSYRYNSLPITLHRGLLNLKEATWRCPGDVCHHHHLWSYRSSSTNFRSRN